MRGNFWDLKKWQAEKCECVKGVGGHSGIAMHADAFEGVDIEFSRAFERGAVAVLEPATEPRGQRTGPEGNLVEVGSWSKPFEIEYEK